MGVGQEPWYKSANIYVVYPDAFKNGGRGNFDSLTDNLGYISSMGFNAIHVLPFLSSPMLDGGFDVSDYFKVRKSLGGNEAFERFLNKARKLGLMVFMDLVINHVSRKHEWFRKALEGDHYYRNLFIHSTQKPKLLRVEKDRSGRWAVYRLGRRNLRARIIFYGKGKTSPHWIKGTGGFWYYHTFYPHQIDLNWTNPDVASEFAKIISFWGQKGLSFRVDAAPFAGKRLTGIVREGARGSHEVVNSLHTMFKKVNPKGAFLIEACQPVSKIKKYFGKRTKKEAELAYNFSLMRGLWAAMVSQKSHFIWDCLKSFEETPAHGQWVTFLRNHDELSLEYANPQQREIIYKSLLESGVEFRGEFGLAGRTASFLHKDEKRIILAHFLLASLNGAPAVVYGDEIGKGTDKRNIKVDPRDSNRGSITSHDIESARGQRIREALAQIFKTRLKFSQVAYSKAEKIFTYQNSVFGVKYFVGKKKLFAMANLNTEVKTISLDLKRNKKDILSVNGAYSKPGGVTLPSYGGIWLVE